MTILDDYKQLCELHLLVSDLAKEYYQNLYRERSLIKSLKSKYRPNDNYKKWSSRARAIARKTFKKGKRMQIDHIRPLLLEFLEGKTPEEASRKDNLQLLSKKANKDKSYLLND